MYESVRIQKEIDRDFNDAVSSVWKVVVSFEHFYKEKDYSESDKLREILKNLGVLVLCDAGKIKLKTTEPLLVSMCDIFNRSQNGLQE